MPSARNRRLCTVCGEANVDRRAITTPGYSDIAHKRAQRAQAIDWLRACGTNPTKLLLMVVDHPLPLSPADPIGATSYFSEDLVVALPGLTKDHVYSANANPEVVEALQAEHGFVNATNLCLCLALERWAPQLRQLGGLHLLNADVWGAFETGPSRPLRQCVTHQLLSPRGALVTFACSNRPARAQGHTVAEDAMRTHGAVRRVFHASRDYEELPLVSRSPFYNTMQAHAFEVVARK
jgi:hypothetical protein